MLLPERPACPYAPYESSYRASPIARKRTPETFEKRRRAIDKQRKRNGKIAERIARKAEKRGIKDGSIPTPEATEDDLAGYFGDLNEPEPTPAAPTPAAPAPSGPKP